MFEYDIPWNSFGREYNKDTLHILNKMYELSYYISYICTGCHFGNRRASPSDHNDRNAMDSQPFFGFVFYSELELKLRVLLIFWQFLREAQQ